MNKEDIWKELCERHPEFLDESNTTRIRVRGLKNLIYQAWEEGYSSGFTRAALAMKERENSNPFLDIFKSFIK
jgi:hypothetical protein